MITHWAKEIRSQKELKEKEIGLGNIDVGGGGGGGGGGVKPPTNYELCTCGALVIGFKVKN